MFLGLRITRMKKDCYLLHPPIYAMHLVELPLVAKFDSFRSVRHHLSRLGQTQPDLVSVYSIGLQVTLQTFERGNVNLLSGAAKRAHTLPSRGLVVHQLYES